MFFKAIPTPLTSGRVFRQSSTKPEGQQFLECYVLAAADGRGKRPTPPPPPSFLSPSSGPPPPPLAAKHDRIVRTAARAAKHRRDRQLVGGAPPERRSPPRSAVGPSNGCLSLPAHFRSSMQNGSLIRQAADAAAFLMAARCIVRRRTSCTHPHGDRHEGCPHFYTTGRGSREKHSQQICNKNNGGCP